MYTIRRWNNGKTRPRRKFQFKPVWIFNWSQLVSYCSPLFQLYMDHFQLVVDKIHLEFPTGPNWFQLGRTGFVLVPTVFNCFNWIWIRSIWSLLRSSWKWISNWSRLFQVFLSLHGKWKSSGLLYSRWLQLKILTDSSYFNWTLPTRKYP